MNENSTIEFDQPMLSESATNGENALKCFVPGRPKTQCPSEGNHISIEILQL